MGPPTALMAGAGLAPVAWLLSQQWASPLTAALSPVSSAAGRGQLPGGPAQPELRPVMEQRLAQLFMMSQQQGRRFKRATTLGSYTVQVGAAKPPESIRKVWKRASWAGSRLCCVPRCVHTTSCWGRLIYTTLTCGVGGQVIIDIVEGGQSQLSRLAWLQGEASLMRCLIIILSGTPLHTRSEADPSFQASQHHGCDQQKHPSAFQKWGSVGLGVSVSTNRAPPFIRDTWPRWDLGNML